jgi:Dcp1-like decapping family
MVILIMAINMDRDGLLTMLRTRIDKAIIEIVFEIQHAVYYQFSETNGTWNKGEIEGPLILVKRNQEAHYCLIILNKQHHNSFYQQVTSETLFEKKHPQLLCIRDKNKNVHGIWSANSDLIDHLYKKLLDIQQIDTQSKMLKNLLDIGVDSSIQSKSPESILDPRPLEFKSQFPTEDILKPEFFQRGVVFEERSETNFEREKLKEVMISLASSDQFLDILIQALKSRGVSLNC